MEVEIVPLGAERNNSSLDSNYSLSVNNTMDTLLNGTPGGGGMRLDVVSTWEMVSFSALFFIIGTIGIIGNVMVICIVFSDSKMRLSMTNMLIVNLAVADLFILIFGVPEIVLFMINKGWLLGPELCRLQRTVLVSSLYCSVMTLLALCVERYIAIVFPIKAHILCTRRRTLLIIIWVWVFAIAFGTPTLIFNIVTTSNGAGHGVQFCILVFPYEPMRFYVIFKYIESVLFYFIPLAVQIICYIIIGKHLFIGIKELHGQGVGRSPRNTDSKRCSDTIMARRGVIKMLVVSVLLYFLSYSPHQVLLFYNTFSPSPFHQNWTYLVGVTILAYINSAGNPIIYCVFSEKYRQKFRAILSCGRKKDYVTNLGDTICLHSSSAHATEYTLLYRKSVQRNGAQRN